MPTGKLRISPPTPSEVSPPGESPLHERALAEKIRQLQDDREHHARAIAEIDAILSRIQEALTALHGRQLEIPEPSMSRSFPTAEGERPRRRYQKLPQTGEESVIAFVRDHGNPTTAEINDHWRSEGRPGVANPTVARLLKRGLLQRQNDPAIRGSRYSVV